MGFISGILSSVLGSTLTDKASRLASVSVARERGPSRCTSRSSRARFR